MRDKQTQTATCRCRERLTETDRGRQRQSERGYLEAKRFIQTVSYKIRQSHTDA